MQHTPGPWFVYREKPGYCAKITTSPDPQCGSLYIASSMSDAYRTKEESQANMLLIAAAPDLLDALKYVRDNHHEGDGKFNDIVNAAITKAEGTS